MTQTLTQELSDLSDAQVGQEVSFYYRGHGEHSQEQRHAKVTEVRPDGILGQDLDHGGPRYFKDTEAYDVSITGNIEGERVSFADAQLTLMNSGQHPAIVHALTGEQLAEVYASIEHPGKTAEFVDGYIVLADVYGGPEAVINDDEGALFAIQGRDGNVLNAYLEEQEGGLTLGYDAWDKDNNHLDGSTNAPIKQWLEGLSRFVLDNQA